MIGPSVVKSINAYNHDYCNIMINSLKIIVLRKSVIMTSLRMNHSHEALKLRTELTCSTLKIHICSLTN